jgi:hypothetical protein
MGNSGLENGEKRAFLRLEWEFAWLRVHRQNDQSDRRIASLVATARYSPVERLDMGRLGFAAPAADFGPGRVDPGILKNRTQWRSVDHTVKAPIRQSRFSQSCG